MGYKLTGAYIYTVRLPSEYQEVEYIQSDWSQWLNTGVKVTNNTKVVNKGYLEAYEWVMYWVWLSWSYQSIVLRDYNLKYRARVRSWASANTTVTSTVSCGTTPHIFELSQGDWFWIDGTKIGSMTSYTFTETQDLYIFWWNGWNSTHMDGSPCSIYYFKMYESGTLIRDLVPCYRKLDNEIWMYDLVTNTFYTNAGTGTFTKWNDVWWLREKQVRPATA